MATENPSWGAPRIHGELAMLGFVVSERTVGSVRRELLDHVVVLNERHLHRLLRDFIAYHHDDRTHLGIAKQAPAGRQRSTRRGASSDVVSLPRLGGLHHRHQLAA